MKFQNLRGGRIVLKDIKVVKNRFIETYLFQSRLRNCIKGSLEFFHVNASNDFQTCPFSHNCEHIHVAIAKM